MVVGTAIRNASRQNAAVRFNGVRSSTQESGTKSLSITVEPFRDRVSQTPCFLIMFDEQEKPIQKITDEGSDYSLDEHAAERIRELEVDLLQARESLQTAVEELETSNEELQASNEELLASNEELQSTNEELHSVNEELYSVNAEHEIKIEELNSVSSNLDNLVRSTPFATIFLDLEHRVRMFTPGAEQFFNLLPKDVGRDLKDFRANHNDESLFSDIENVRSSLEIHEREISHKELGSHLRRISPFRDTNNQFDGFVLAFIELGASGRVLN
jgi:two-component system CheB/CheR fusion protein